MSTPRERIVHSASLLLRTRGANGVGLREIVDAAQAPWGSLQHYFPGGKEQLIVEAIAYGGAQVGGVLDHSFTQAPDAEGAMAWFFEASARELEQSGYDMACPVAVVALEHAALQDAIARACAEVLEDWTARLTRGFAASGLGAAAATRLATATVSQYEGALLLCRAQRTATPMRTGGAVVGQLIAAAR